MIPRDYITARTRRGCRITASPAGIDRSGVESPYSCAERHMRNIRAYAQYIIARRPCKLRIYVV
jgi:hypothetical protein